MAKEGRGGKIVMFACRAAEKRMDTDTMNQMERERERGRESDDVGVRAESER